MMPESTIANRSPMELLLMGAFQIVVVLLICWFGTRRQRDDFRFGRVVVLTLSCLATALPFAIAAYLLRPWDWESRLLRTMIALAALMPLVTAFALGFSKRLRRNSPD
jgi:hypothetical protein